MVEKVQVFPPGEERHWPIDQNELQIWMLKWFVECLPLIDRNAPPTLEQLHDMAGEPEYWH